jgi:hypothetical protein
MEYWDAMTNGGQLGMTLTKRTKTVGLRRERCRNFGYDSDKNTINLNSASKN